MLVAVYGTLKRGYENYEKYLAGRQPVHAVTASLPFAMFACADYPMLVPSAREHPVLLEIFDVDAERLDALDALEEPYHYERRTVRLEELRLDVGLYVHPEAPPSHFRQVVTGNWRREDF